MDEWLREAKQHESAKDIGMYLTHNGTVRSTAKAKVRAGAEDFVEVVYRSYAAAYCERYVYIVCCFFYNVEKYIALFVRCRYIIKNELVCSCVAVEFCKLDRIVNVLKSLEFYALYYSSVVYVEARNYSFSQQFLHPPSGNS